MKRKNTKWFALLSAACIALTCCVFPNVPLGREEQIVSAKTLAEIEAEKEAIRKEQQEKQSELDALSADIADQEAYQAVLQDKIDLINAELQLIHSQLQSLNADINAKNADIAQLEADIAAQEAEIQTGLEDFKARIRTLYMHGNDSLLSALVGATDFYDVLAKIDLINRIAEHDDLMMDTLTTQLEALNTSKTDLDARVQALTLKKTETEAVRAEFDVKYQDLDAAMAETTAVKLELERQKNDAENWIAENQARLDSLAAEEQAVLDEIKRQEEERQASSNNPVYIPPEGSGTFAWPVPNFYYISSQFGPRWGRNHNGIDIAGGGIHNAPIIAAGGGTVTRVVSGCSHDYSGFCGCGGGFGNYVIVSHGNGLCTVYAHMSRVAVSVGDAVSAGTVIGYVGATGNSTGYHLHFAVTVNGTYVNPEPYL